MGGLCIHGLACESALMRRRLSHLSGTRDPGASQNEVDSFPAVMAQNRLITEFAETVKQLANGDSNSFAPRPASPILTQLLSVPEDLSRPRTILFAAARSWRLLRCLN